MKKVFLAVCLMVTFSLPAFADMQHMPMDEHKAHGQMEMCEKCDMHRGGMEYHRMGDMIGRCLQLADKIGLSEDQINKLKPLHREMLKKQIRFKADLKLARIDLMEIMEVKDFDMEKASAAVKKIGDMKTEHHLEMLKTMKEARSILTDDQFKKMKKMMHMRMEEHKQPQKAMKKK